MAFQELFKDKNKFDLIINHLECPLIYLSNTLINDANKIAIKILKLNPQSYFNCCFADHCKSNNFSLVELLDSNEINITIKETYIIDQQPYTILWRKITLPTEYDKKLSVLVGKNITEEKLATEKLEDSVYFYENILSKLPTNVYWKDRNLVYRGCNDRLARSMGLPSRNAIKGMTDYDFDWGDGAAESFIEFDKKIIKSGKSLTTEDTFKEANGKLVTVLTNKTPLRDKEGNITGVLAISVDITKLKKIEKELIQARKLAEESSNAKSEFIANMSHDIRTPLTGIIGISQAMEYKAQDSEEKEFARMINASGEQLLNLLNGVLDVVCTDELHEKDLQETTFSIHQCIENIRILELPMIKHKGLDFKVEIDNDIPPFLISDETKLHRILLNLVGNAIKFTKTGYVSLFVTLLEQKKDSVNLRFSVHDTGIGIDKEVQNKLFEQFYRVNPSYKGVYAGYGIGLHIAQKYVELLKSTIKLISTKGKGATFYFELWLKKGDKDSSKDVNHVAKALSQNSNIQPLSKKLINDNHAEEDKTLIHLDSTVSYILLVEDNKPALITLENQIKSTGCKFISAMNGEEALTLAINHNFDLIITDIGLPGISGLELSQNFRKWELSKNKTRIPIIALTGHAEEDIRLQDKNSSIDKVLTKPMQRETLQSILNEYGLLKNNDVKSNLTKLSLPKLESQLFEINKFTVFDKEKGLAFCKNNEKLKNQLENFIIRIDEVELSINRNECSTLDKMVFSIREAAACFGAIRLEYASFYVENYYKKDSNPVLLEKLVWQFHEVMRETRQYFINWLLRKDIKQQNVLVKDLPDTEDELFDLEQYPLLDVSYGIGLSGVSESEFFNLLNLFVMKEVPEDKRAIEEAYSIKDWDKVEKLSHKLKGGTDYMGAIRMKYACMYLERYRKAGYSILLEKLYQQLIKTLDETLECIKYRINGSAN